VVSFLFADLIVLPILNIYRRYYGPKMAAAIFGIFYASMVLAAVAVEFGFQMLGSSRSSGMRKWSRRRSHGTTPRS
jgi:hypothetical protein